MYDSGEHYPKILPCSHTVCLQCLDRIVATFARDTGQFRCPICRELITIPRGGVKTLPPSFLVNQLLDLMARQRREVIPKCSTHQTQVRFRNVGSSSDRVCWVWLIWCRVWVEFRLSSVRFGSVSVTIFGFWFSCQPTFKFDGETTTWSHFQMFHPSDSGETFYQRGAPGIKRSR